MFETISFKKTNKTKKNNKNKHELKSLYALFAGKENAIYAFKNIIFPLAPIECTGRPSNLASHLKILTPKQILQRLPIAPAQVKADDTSENLLNKICQITYFLYQAKEITIKKINNIMNSR